MCSETACLAFLKLRLLSLAGYLKVGICPKQFLFINFIAVHIAVVQRMNVVITTGDQTVEASGKQAHLV